MSKIAFVFPGQGAQFSGMGKELYEASAGARQVFDRLERLRPGLSELCFAGTTEALSRTDNTQPCLFAVSLAAVEALRERGVTADICAGFSLGELCAITHSGALSLEDGFSLICRRAVIMQAAAQSAECCMAAVVRLTGTETEQIAAQFPDVYPVNYNSPQQTVVALVEAQLSAFSEAVAERGGRAIRLNVSGGFHSPFMQDAAREFEAALRNYRFAEPQIPVYANVDASPYAHDFHDKLYRQLYCPVLWQRTIERMAADGAALFIEAGAGSTVTGLIKKIVPDIAAVAAGTIEGIDEAVRLIKEHI